MLFKEKKGVEWLEFELLQPYQEIKHGVFLKNYEGAHCQSYQKKIKESLELQSLVFGKQCHQDQVIEILSGDQHNHQSSDGLFTSLKKTSLCIFHADCQAVLFYDPCRKVIANVHCGWKGNQHNILGKTVEILNKTKGCSPRDLIVCISPSLGPQKAEFIHYEQEWPPSFHQYQFRPFHFDLWKMSEDQLKIAGVPSSQIEIAGVCTHTEEKKFFSYRRDKTTKRNISIIALI